IPMIYPIIPRLGERKKRTPTSAAANQTSAEKERHLSNVLFPGSVLGNGWCCLTIALFGMLFCGFSPVMNCVLIVSMSKVCVVCSLFVFFGLIVFCRLIVMIGGLLMMTSRVMVMFPCL